MSISQRSTDAYGRPCYPIELAPEIYKNPGLYKDIVSYLDGSGLGSRLIGCQLERWNKFREF